MRIGFHVSIAGGFAFAVRRAFDLGCNTMQIFSRNPRGWRVKPIHPEDIARFKKLREEWDFGPVFVHANYLINLASPRNDLFEKSIEHFIVDLERAEQLGAEYLVTHMGSARGMDPGWMIDRVSEALNQAMKIHHPRADILLENTAGEAGDVGYSLEQIQKTISRLNHPSPIGLCYDTCHGFAAGYDIKTRRDTDLLVKKIDATVGLQRLKLIHLNDSLRDFNSHVDRHWHIGEGKIGLDGFKALLNQPEFVAIPKIMETPKKTEDDDPRNMKLARSLIL